MSTFAERIKQLRKEHGLTQEKLAKLFFLNKSSISKYEHGKHIPENELLQKIADYFEVSTDYLLGRSDERKKTSKYSSPNAERVSEISKQIIEDNNEDNFLFLYNLFKDEDIFNDNFNKQEIKEVLQPILKIYRKNKNN